MLNQIRRKTTMLLPLALVWTTSEAPIAVSEKRINPVLTSGLAISTQALALHPISTHFAESPSLGELYVHSNGAEPLGTSKSEPNQFEDQQRPAQSFEDRLRQVLGLSGAFHALRDRTELEIGALLFRDPLIRAGSISKLIRLSEKQVNDLIQTMLSHLASYEGALRREKENWYPSAEVNRPVMLIPEFSASDLDQLVARNGLVIGDLVHANSPFWRNVHALGIKPDLLQKVAIVVREINPEAHIPMAKGINPIRNLQFTRNAA
jgi:hypothetical protein